MFRKVLVGALAMILGSTGSVFFSSPANATVFAGSHNYTSIEELSVGQSVDIDYSCREDTDPITYTVTTVSWDTTGALPNGLTLDQATFHIIGSPTTTGLFPLPDIHCRVEGGGVNLTTSVATGALQVTDPNAPPSAPGTPPAAELSVIPLRDSSCSFTLDAYFPSGSDEDSARLRISSGDQFLLISGKDPGTHSRLTLKADDLRSSSISDALTSESDWTFTGESAGAMGCRDTLKFELTYTLDDVQSDTSVVDNIRPTFSEATMDGEKFIDGASCVMAFEYYFDADPTFDNSLGGNFGLLHYYESDFSIDFKLSGYQVGDWGYLEYDLSTGSLTVNDHQKVTVISQHGSAPGCDSNGTAVFGFESTSGYASLGETEDIQGLPKCGKGEYSATGLFDSFSRCTEAPLGKFVNTIGAKTATACPEGMTTEFAGSASAYDCFKPILQTMKKLVGLKGLKLGKTFGVISLTDQKSPMRIRVSGACTVTGTSINNVPQAKIVASKKAGTCVVTLESPATGRFAALNKVIRVKVSKTGK